MKQKLIDAAGLLVGLTYLALRALLIVAALYLLGPLLAIAIPVLTLCYAIASGAE